MRNLMICGALALIACGSPEPKDEDATANNGVAANNGATTGNNGGNTGGPVNNGTFEISDEVLSGTVAGEPFVFASGSAQDVFGEGELWVDLHTTEVEDPCGFAVNPDGAKIILTSTGEPMDEPLSFSNNITFSYGEGENDIATTGRLVIDGIDGDVLRGGLYAVMGDHIVNGRFEVPVCAE